jgi:glyoxylase-like metal-dependent hydrolase (beta-lactamase superfamily II)
MDVGHALPVETISLPTPFGVGHVNAFLIVEEPMTMIDAGVNTVDAENALKLGFAAKGLFVESIERILITHGHPDHYGLVPLICNNGSDTVRAYMGEQEVERITAEGPVWEGSRRLMEAGFPEALLRELTRLERRMHRVHKVAQLRCLPVKDGQVFEFRDFALHAVSLPGHTEGHVGYLEPESRVLFAGDALLPHVRPNPLLEPMLEPEGDSPSRRRHSLKEYLASLDRLQSLDLSCVYPGHGQVITNPPEAIEYMRQHHARRLDQVSESLLSESSTAYEVSKMLYPKAEAYARLMAVSEAMAHLDVLVEQGRAKHEIRENGVEYFSRIPS